jgi:Cu/Ag efflux pump CusA
MITGWPFVIMMMMRIISLAGIVVNNGVVLLDTELLLSRKRRIKFTRRQPFRQVSFEAIVNGGKARLRPVLLTITTVLDPIGNRFSTSISFHYLAI